MQPLQYDLESNKVFYILWLLMDSLTMKTKSEIRYVNTA